MEPAALLNILRQSHCLDVKIHNVKSFTAKDIYEAVDFLGDIDLFNLERIIKRKRKSPQATVEAVLKYMNHLSPRRSFSLHGTTELKIMEVIKHPNIWGKKSRNPAVSTAGFLQY